MKLLARNILSPVLANLQYKEFMIITGPRQCGKTSLLRLIEKDLQEQGEKPIYISLEDPEVLKRLNQHPENLFTILPQNERRVFVLIDEIQYLSDPTNFLKYNFDFHHEKVKIICTGSSAFYIDQGFRDSLAGRKLIFNLFTLNFDEFLYFKTGDESLKNELLEMKSRADYLSPQIAIIRRLQDEYLTFGGYPEVVLAENNKRKIFLLRELSQSFIKRDIQESNVRDQEKFFVLLRLLAAQTGGLVNVNQLANSLHLSVTSVENYLQILKKTFQIQLVRPFFNNLKKELTKMPKVYFNDLGMRNVLLNQFTAIESRIDRGELIENYIFVRLRNIYSPDELNFWRTADGNEVDFIIQTGIKQGFSIESKFDENTFSSSKYRKFKETYPSYPLQIRAYINSGNATSLLTI